MNKKILILAAAAMLGVFASNAQARKGLKINEVMTVNQTNAIDEYGQRGAWIELYNSTYKPMKIASVFLTDDPQNPTKYPVPQGDLRTNLEKRQHVVFWADGKATRGALHTNFQLKPDQPNWIGLYDADGITLIDSITVPVLEADYTFARRADGEGESVADWEVRTDAEGSCVTFGSNNVIKDTNSKVDKFAKVDPRGFGLSITAMGIVFFALLLLSVCFYVINKIMTRRSQRKKMEAHGSDRKDVARSPPPEGDTGEATAAIAAALNEHLNAHDLESTILTIAKTRKNYSPWSSHIYNLRQLPRR